ncbi:hypothetical protein D3C73_1114840 [compost metagenome]
MAQHAQAAGESGGRANTIHLQRRRGHVEHALFTRGFVDDNLEVLRQRPGQYIGHGERAWGHDGGRQRNAVLRDFDARLRVSDAGDGRTLVLAAL